MSPERDDYEDEEEEYEEEEEPRSIFANPWFRAALAGLILAVVGGLARRPAPPPGGAPRRPRGPCGAGAPPQGRREACQARARPASGAQGCREARGARQAGAPGGREACREARRARGHARRRPGERGLLGSGGRLQRRQERL